MNRTRRERELAALDAAGAPPVDLLVVGGGVTGAGVALDAATRGLSVVLAEKHDLAFGTSRWSSKLVHGGLRYLASRASGSIGIARESAAERHVLMTRTAPHLVSALPQVLPLLPGVSRRRAALVRAGFAAGDVLRRGAGTPAAVLPRSRRIAAAEVLRLVPTVRADGLRGGLLGWDGQLCDDARLVVALARTAAAHGAVVLTRCAASELTGQGAVLTDTLTGRRLDLRARMVVNAAGVWAGELAADVWLRPSRGTHLVLAQAAFGGLRAGLTVSVDKSTNRFAFALPAPDGRVYVGLTDVDAPGPIPDEPVAVPEEVDFLLDTLNPVLAAPLGRADVLGTYSGLRPLLAAPGDAAATADLSRRHAVLTGADGLVSVVGGKLTTYRRMAQDAVDAALRAAAGRGPAAVPAAGRCRTREVALVGAAPRRELGRVPAPEDLVRRYGTEAVAVLGLAGSGGPLGSGGVAAGGDPSRLEPLAPGLATCAAELDFAIAHEGALDVADLLDRRTRVGLVAADRAAAEPAARQALAAAGLPPA